MTVTKNTLAARLGALALAASAMSFAAPAQAQVQSSGWFGSLTGWYIVDPGNDGTCIYRPGCDVGSLVPTKGPGDGWGG